MKDFKVWDLHCDTLYALLEADKNGSPARFDKNGLMIDLERLRSGNYLLQCFACFVDLAEPGDPLVKALQEADRFQQILAAFPDDLMWVRTPADIDALLRGGRIGAMLTAEEGGICKDDPAVLRTLYRLGVRMMTLTWNHKNGLAEPNLRPGPAAWPPQPNTTGGLTETGFAFLQEMERLHMIVDVSHLSDAGIWDVLRAGRRPFAASHSSARACCPHPRNLTDEQFTALVKCGGGAGLNLCADFIGLGQDIGACCAHIEHFLALGGEKSLFLGTDFDGIAAVPRGLYGVQDMWKLYEALLERGHSEELVQDIFYGDLLRILGRTA